MIERHKPDVLFLDEKMYASYAQEGKLYSLEDVIAEDKFDLKGYNKLGVIDNLRAKGNGTLCGRVPSFSVPVLYYNRDLFEENNIDFPRNKMSWEEVLDLSKRFEGIGSGKNRVFGLYQSFEYTVDVLQHIAGTFSLQMFDPKGKKLLINSDDWKKAVKLATDAVRSKTVSLPSHNGGSHDDDAFMNGKAAMTIGQPWRLQDLKGDPGAYSTKAKKINWDMVTIPVDPKTPDESAHVQLGDIYAIPADSPNKRAAWEFI